MFLLFLLMFGGRRLYKRMYIYTHIYILQLIFTDVQSIRAYICIYILQLIVANVQNAHLVSLRLSLEA